ncbi:MAG: 1,4-dihydroxy-6-naphthoate synthase [Chitinophagaceae bacterium]|nr:1,4-dihydroxy-6-naphthoate synthase [Chitinophagaceae bacterium]
MKFTLGFSPCPNDTFIFDALVNKKIDTGNMEFDVVLEDVQTLNRWAIEGKLDISKISYGVLPLVLAQYKILHSGGALGKGVGPLLISANPVNIYVKDFDINDYTIAIPGENTTAHLLFSLAFPNAKNKVFKIFHEIEDFLLTNAHQKTLGVIIHENRFTYQHKGLHKLIDLGEFWEKKTGYPIPLGGIAVRKNILPTIQADIDKLIQQSIKYAFNNYPSLPEYVKLHSQEMEEIVMRQHIDLYVNNYSINIGEDGKEAVNEFLNIYERNNPVSSINHNVFI